MAHRWLVLLAFLLGLVSLTACMKKALPPPPAPPPPPAEFAEVYGGMPAAEMARAPSRKELSVARDDADWEAEEGEIEASPEPTGGAEAPAAVAQPRMVFYEGFAHLRDTRAAELRSTIEAYALSLGGLVEQSAGNQVIIRVPVARFDEAFAHVLTLAEVLGRSVRAQDVTEAYQDAALRLETARRTLTRLQQLLAEATKEEDKLALLREIQRVTEQVDAAERERATLGRLAALSRIVVLIDGSGPSSYSPAEPFGVAWVDGLHPFHDQVLVEAKPLRPLTPAGFVALSLRGPWVAESADGAVLRSGRLDNTPFGDTGWWAQTLLDRLGAQHEDAQILELGGWKVIRLVQPGAREWRWWIAVRADGRWLDVLEATFPSEVMEERYRQAVEGLFQGGAS